jgi:hypothetical protein
MLLSASAEALGSTVYLATDRGILKSVDSGDSWVMIRDRYPAEQARVVAAHPTMPDIVYAGGAEGLLRSIDGGQSWNPVIAITSSVKGVVFSPANPLTVYVVADQFWRTKDAGETWDVFASDLPDAPVSIAVDYLNEARAFLLTRAGLFRTEDGGVTFAKLGPQVYSPFANVAVGAIGTTQVYIAHEGGIQFSADSGNTWKALDIRSPTGSGQIGSQPMFEMVFIAARSLAADPHDSARLLACGVTRVVTWDGQEVVSGPGIYESTAMGGGRVFGMHENNSFTRPGSPPDCFFSALDRSPNGGAWIGTARGLLYAPAGQWLAWREVQEFRDVAVYAATFANPE